MIETTINDPCGHGQTDRFVITQDNNEIYQFTLAEWEVYKRQHRLFPTKVKEKGGLLHLPTKAVTVTSKTGLSFIRRQHVSDKKPEHHERQKRSEEEPIVEDGKTHLSDLKMLMKKGEVEPSHLKKIGEWLTRVPETNDYTAAKDTMSALSNIIQKDPNRIHTLDAMDLDHKIAGTSIRGYLADAFGSGHPLTDHIVSKDFTVNKDSSILDKAAALYGTAVKSRTVPRDEQVDFINNQLSQFVDAKFMAYSFEKFIDHRIEHVDNKQNIRKDFLTVLDHTLTRTTPTNLAAFYKKVHDKVLVNKDAKGLENEIPRLIGSSIDPKKMDTFLTEARLKKPSVNEDVTATDLMSGWMQGTFNGTGLLVRRAAQSILGSDLPGRAHINSIEDTHFPLDKITEDKVPVHVSKGLRRLHKLTQEYVKTNKSSLFKEGLYRGIEFEKNSKTNVFRPSVSSTSLSYDIAAGFSKESSGRNLALFGHTRYKKENINELYDKHQVLLSAASKPYIKNVHHTGVGGNKQFVIEYDHEKLLKDRKMIMALTDEGMEFYKNNGISIPKNYERYRNDKELVITI